MPYESIGHLKKFWRNPKTKSVVNLIGFFCFGLYLMGTLIQFNASSFGCETFDLGIHCKSGFEEFLINAFSLFGLFVCLLYAINIPVLLSSGNFFGALQVALMFIVMVLPPFFTAIFLLNTKKSILERYTIKKKHLAKKFNLKD